MWSFSFRSLPLIFKTLFFAVFRLRKELALAVRKPAVAALVRGQPLMRLWVMIARPVAAAASRRVANLRMEIPRSETSIDIAIEGTPC